MKTLHEQKIVSALEPIIRTLQTHQTQQRFTLDTRPIAAAVDAVLDMLEQQTSPISAETAQRIQTIAALLDRKGVKIRNIEPGMLQQYIEALLERCAQLPTSEIQSTEPSRPKIQQPPSLTDTLQHYQDLIHGIRRSFFQRILHAIELFVRIFIHSFRLTEGPLNRKELAQSLVQDVEHATLIQALLRLHRSDILSAVTTLVQQSDVSESEQEQAIAEICAGFFDGLEAIHQAGQTHIKTLDAYLFDATPGAVYPASTIEQLENAQSTDLKFIKNVLQSLIKAAKQKREKTVPEKMIQQAKQAAQSPLRVEAPQAIERIELLQPIENTVDTNLLNAVTVQAHVKHIQTKFAKAYAFTISILESAQTSVQALQQRFTHLEQQVEQLLQLPQPNAALLQSLQNQLYDLEEAFQQTLQDAIDQSERKIRLLASSPKAQAQIDNIKLHVQGLLTETFNILEELANLRTSLYFKHVEYYLQEALEFKELAKDRALLTSSDVKVRNMAQKAFNDLQQGVNGYLSEPVQVLKKLTQHPEQYSFTERQNMVKQVHEHIEQLLRKKLEISAEEFPQTHAAIQQAALSIQKLAAYVALHINDHERYQSSLQRAVRGSNVVPGVTLAEEELRRTTLYNLGSIDEQERLLTAFNHTSHRFVEGLGTQEKNGLIEIKIPVTEAHSKKLALIPNVLRTAQEAEHQAETMHAQTFSVLIQTAKNIYSMNSSEERKRSAINDKARDAYSAVASSLAYTGSLQTMHDARFEFITQSYQAYGEQFIEDANIILDLFLNPSLNLQQSGVALASELKSLVEAFIQSANTNKAEELNKIRDIAQHIKKLLPAMSEQLPTSLKKAHIRLDNIRVLTQSYLQHLQQSGFDSFAAVTQAIQKQDRTVQNNRSDFHQLHEHTVAFLEIAQKYHDDVKDAHAKDVLNPFSKTKTQKIRDFRDRIVALLDPNHEQAGLSSQQRIEALEACITEVDALFAGDKKVADAATAVRSTFNSVLTYAKRVYAKEQFLAQKPVVLEQINQFLANQGIKDMMVYDFQVTTLGDIRLCINKQSKKDASKWVLLPSTASNTSTKDEDNEVGIDIDAILKQLAKTDRFKSLVNGTISYPKFFSELYIMCVSKPAE